MNHTHPLSVTDIYDCPCICVCTVLTLRMRRMAAMPDVAITLALLGTRLSSVGIRVSAQWSNLFPSNVDRYLKRRWERFKISNQ